MILSKNPLAFLDEGDDDVAPPKRRVRKPARPKRAVKSKPKAKPKPKARPKRKRVAPAYKPAPKSANGVMTAAEFSRQIKAWGLTPAQAGEWLGLTGRQGYRYATGESEVTELISKLFRVMDKFELTPGDV